MKRFFNAILTLSLLAFVGCGELVENFADYVNGTLAPGGSGNSENTGTTESTQVVYKVGDYYNVNGKEGVVFWVDETGRHGKIVSLVESGGQWSSDVTECRTFIGATNETDGAKNMAVVKQIADWESKYPVFAWCAELGEDWYLPAIKELELLLLDESVHDAVDQTMKDKGANLADIGIGRFYCSSTEYYKNGDLGMWGVYLYNATTTYREKSAYTHYFIYAVSAF